MLVFNYHCFACFLAELSSKWVQETKQVSQNSLLGTLLFRLFLSMYLVTTLENLLIVLAISSDYDLHTPMYFILFHLSFSDICFNSTMVPKILVNIHTENKAITYAGHIIQVHFFIVFGYLDIFLQTIMVYDQFVAICHVLHNSHCMICI